MKNRRIFYVLSSHWDREWYQSFQQYRYRMVQLMNKTIGALESGELAGPFYMDGQSILAEDYLEIHPEKRAAFGRLVETGKIRMGPWYVQPDEFCVSGESLIRNLQLGREIARSHGGIPSNTGFVCDQFGHNSQMPQIFIGFGIETAMLWRGIILHDKRHFIWKGADGSKLACYRWGGHGYCDFGFRVREANQAGKSFDADGKRQLLEKYIAHEAQCSETDAILLFDGGDHLEFDPETYALIRDKIERGEIEHVDADTYMADVLAQHDMISPIREGELREPGLEIEGSVDTMEVIQGVLSSRVWIKQRNAACEALLTRWTEPFCAFASRHAAMEYPQGFLDTAWKWLIQNHPHDSICGCSIDAVHEDMKFRFSQCEQIAGQLVLAATAKLSANVAGGIGEKELRITVFNPAAEPFCGTTEITVPVPKEWPRFSEFFGYENKPSFRLYGPDGCEIPYQRIAQAEDRIKYRIHSAKFPEAWRTDDVTVSLPLNIPACGYTTITAKAGEAAQNQGLRLAEKTRHAEHRGLAVSERAMENETLRVEIQTNGTLRVTDKKSGACYANLLTFEDTADIGDGWNHGIAVNDQTFVSSACAADIALVHNGPYITAFRIRTAMRIPESFDSKTMCRSGQFVEMVLDSHVSLRPGSGKIEVKTRIQNPAGNHRVRVLFPSGCAKAKTYLADSPFDVVERRIGLREDRHQYKELEVETKPQQSWTAVSEQGKGLAVISKGLLESAVRDLEDRPIALTLFRSTQRTVLTDGEPEGQLLGRMLEFDYCIQPIAGAPNRVELCRAGQELAAGLRTVIQQAADLDLYRDSQNLPPVTGFMRVSGGAVVSSIRQMNDAVEVRLFNPDPQPVQIEIAFSHRPAGMDAPQKMQPVNFESQPVGEAIPIRDARFKAKLNAKEIKTLQFMPARP